MISVVSLVWEGAESDNPSTGLWHCRHLWRQWTYERWMSLSNTSI